MAPPALLTFSNWVYFQAAASKHALNDDHPRRSQDGQAALDVESGLRHVGIGEEAPVAVFVDFFSHCDKAR